MPDGMKERGGSRMPCWGDTRAMFSQVFPPPPPQTPEEWRLWGGSRLLADEEFAFGHVVGVWQDTCSWVRTQDQRDSEEGAAPGVWVGGLDLRVSSGQWIWNRREQARC